MLHQEGAEGSHHAWEHDTPIAIQPTEFARHQIPWNNQHFGRDHQGRKDRKEDEIAAPELEFSQRITDKAVEKNVRQSHDYSHDHRIHEPAQKAPVSKNGGIVLERWLRRNKPQIIDLTCSFQRG
ncbi:hypothetical protein D3C81_1875390 [compost metagenome]